MKYTERKGKNTFDAHPCRVIYAVSEEDDAKKISEKLGYIPHDLRVPVRQAAKPHPEATLKMRLNVH